MVILLCVRFAGGLILFGGEEIEVPGWEPLVAFVEQAAVVAESLLYSLVKAELDLWDVVSLPGGQRGHHERPKLPNPKFDNASSANTASRRLSAARTCHQSRRLREFRDQQATDS